MTVGSSDDWSAGRQSSSSIHELWGTGNMHNGMIYNMDLDY